MSDKERAREQLIGSLIVVLALALTVAVFGSAGWGSVIGLGIGSTVAHVSALRSGR